MKKYLLLATYGSYEVDDENLEIVTTQVGSYDTVTEAIEAAKQDLTDAAEEFADYRYDKDTNSEDYKEFLYNYFQGTTINDLDEKSFPRIGADRIVIEHEYYEAYQQDKRIYVIIRIF